MAVQNESPRNRSRSFRWFKRLYIWGILFVIFLTLLLPEMTTPHKVERRLRSLSRWASFGVTDKKLAELRIEGITQDALYALETMKGQLFKEESIFLIRISEKIGHELSEEDRVRVLRYTSSLYPYKYKDSVLKYTSFFRGLSDFVTGNILIISLFHMVILIIVGWLFIKVKEEKLIVGSNIQTAGYLHTLIGFSGALFTLSQENGGEFDLNRMLPSLGSALVTSIIGWFLGGEIESHGETPEPDVVLERYTKAIDKSTEAINNTTIKITTIGESYEELLKQQSDGLENIQKVVETISTKFNEISTSAQKASVTVNSASEGVTRFLGESFLTSIEKVRTEGSKLESSLDSVVKNFTILASTSEQLRSQMEKSPEAIQALQQVSEIAKELQRNLESVGNTYRTLRDQQTNSLEQLDVTVKGLHKNFEHISGSAASLSTTMSASSEGVAKHLGNSFLTSIESIGKEGKNVEGELSKVVQGLRTLATTSEQIGRQLEQSPLAIDALQRVVHAAGELEPHLATMSTSVGEVAARFNEVAEHSRDNLGEEFLHTISTIRVTGTNVAQEMHTVVQELRALAETSRNAEMYLSQSRTLAEELEKLIKFIGSR